MGKQPIKPVVVLLNVQRLILKYHKLNQLTGNDSIDYKNSNTIKRSRVGSNEE
jgi:hypothetical protein